MDENTTLDLQTESVPETSTRVCQKCNEPLQESQKFCSKCGAEYISPQEPASPVCSNCGQELAADAEFCPNCGTKQQRTLSTEKKTSLKNKKWFLPALIGGGIIIIAVIAIVLFLAFRTIPVEFIKLSESSIELTEGETISVSCTVYPDKATDKTIVWTSSDTTVATVNSYGLITAVKRGTCTVTVKCGDFSEKITVTIKPNVDFKQLYEGIDSDAKYGWKLGSDNSYLTADTNVYDLDDYSNSSILYSIRDMNKSLSLPESLFEEMLQTTWSMGKQKETFDKIGVEITWTYHPNKGMEVTYKLISD